MLKLVRRSGIIIPKNEETISFYWKVQEHLIRKNKDYNTGEYKTNVFFYEKDDYFVVPRFFPIEEYVNCKIYDNTEDGFDINITHNINPRNETQEKALKYMMTHDNSIMQLEPGTGKTVMSTYMIAERKKKTFILVHRDSLVDQWKDEIIKFTNLKDKDIVRLKSSNYEEALKSPIIITTDQTFCSILKSDKKEKFIECLDKSGIGVFIGDEVHTTVGAPTFSECSLHIPAKVVYGLSATPYRYDGNSDIINYHLGEIYEDDSDEGTMSARVTVILTDYGIDIPRRYKYLHWKGDFQRSRYLNMTRKCYVMYNICMGLLNKFKEERDIILISERIEVLDKLYDWLDEESKAKFIAGSKNEELKKKVVFSTPLKIRDGVNIPRKDCLIVTVPVQNMKQLAGRVVRTSKDKQEPIVIDMVDIGSKRIRSTFYPRLKFYDSKEWKVQFVYVSKDTGKQTLLNREDAIKLVKGEPLYEDKVGFCNQ